MEKLMHYVWLHRLFPAERLKTVDGKRLEIISPGTYNPDSGPDFFNAAIAIDGQTWAGNVEIHIKASDWYNHHHDRDKAYDSVILHVVDTDNMKVKRRDGTVIPQFRMPCSPLLNSDYLNLTKRAPIELPCASTIKTIPQLYVTDWLSALAYERVQQKADRISQERQYADGSWEEAAYMTLARSLGSGKNSDQMERLARLCPLRILRKQADSLTATEAILFGQSGLLPQSTDQSTYAGQLFSEYSFYAAKYGLSPMDSATWRMGRMRPLSLPYRRIALLAALIARRGALLDSILEVRNFERAAKLFSIELSPFWDTHYTFTTPTENLPPVLGKNAIELMMINAVIPLKYAFAVYNGHYEQSTEAVEMLHRIKAESNSIVELFSQAGLRGKSAFTSQALIQLRRQYCEPRKCLYCRIGHRYLAGCALRPS